MPQHVFTYGSLMFPAVWQRVVRGNYRSATAILDNHARYAVRGVDYPGVVAQDHASVEGVLYFNVAEEDLARLDMFEGSEYRRIAVPLQAGSVAGGATELVAHTYLYLDPARLSAVAWSPERFDLPHFIASYCSMRGVA